MTEWYQQINVPKYFTDGLMHMLCPEFIAHAEALSTPCHGGFRHMTCHHAKRWYAKYINLLFHVRKLLAIYSVVYRVIVVGLKNGGPTRLLGLGHGGMITLVNRIIGSRLMKYEQVTIGEDYFGKASSIYKVSDGENELPTARIPPIRNIIRLACLCKRQ